MIVNLLVWENFMRSDQRLHSLSDIDTRCTASSKI